MYYTRNNPTPAAVIYRVAFSGVFPLFPVASAVRRKKGKIRLPTLYGYNILYNIPGTQYILKYVCAIRSRLLVRVIQSEHGLLQGWYRALFMAVLCFIIFVIFVLCASIGG